MYIQEYKYQGMLYKYLTVAIAIAIVSLLTGRPHRVHIRVINVGFALLDEVLQHSRCNDSDQKLVELLLAVQSSTPGLLLVRGLQMKFQTQISRV